MEVLQEILSACGAISIIGGAGAVIVKIIRPAWNLSKRVEILEKHDLADFERVKALDNMQKQQSKCLAAIANHMIDGNGIENMKKTRDELLASIIEH